MYQEKKGSTVCTQAHLLKTCNAIASGVLIICIWFCFARQPRHQMCCWPTAGAKNSPERSLWHIRPHSPTRKFGRESFNIREVTYYLN